MKKSIILGALALSIVACSTQPAQQSTPSADVNWSDYNVGKILFEDKSPESEGSRIYHSLIPNPEEYIA